MTPPENNPPQPPASTDSIDPDQTIQGGADPSPECTPVGSENPLFRPTNGGTTNK